MAAGSPRRRDGDADVLGREGTPSLRTPPPLIEARGLTKLYETPAGPVPALRGVDVTVRAGEVVALLGPSGCGKTTLINCCSGLDTPTEGTVRLDGTDVHTMKDRDRTRLRAGRMGFVFQAFNLIPVLSAVENVELPLFLTGVGRHRARERAVGALARVGLADKTDRLPAQLSGGEQQRVALARSIVGEPLVVWADEPTGNLDAATGRRVLELVVELNTALGQTYVIATHDLKVIEIADRVLTMDSGRVVQQERGGRRR